VLSSATLPTTVTGDVSFSGSQFSSGAYACSVGLDLGAFGNDHVYSFTAPEGAIYTFTKAGNPNIITYVLSSCVGAANADAACIEEVFQTYGPHHGEPVRVPMTAGETVFVVVDGGWWESDGTYTLTVGAPCHPVCGGIYCGEDTNGCGGPCGCDGKDVCTVAGLCTSVSPGATCATALPIPTEELPIFINGDTAKSDFDFFAHGCDNQHGDGLPDVVYEFTPPVTGSYELFELTMANAWQSFAVWRDCGGPTGSCQSYTEPASSAKPKIFALEAGVPVHIVIDPFYGPGGPFTLKISLAP
jgi:hypothetical protein